MSGDVEVTRHGWFRWGWRVRVDGEHFYGKGPTRWLARRRASAKLTQVLLERSRRRRARFVDGRP